jgi:hypothetical protein
VREVPGSIHRRRQQDQLQWVSPSAFDGLVWAALACVPARAGRVRARPPSSRTIEYVASHR